MVEPVRLRVDCDDPRRYLSWDGDDTDLAHRAFFHVKNTLPVLGLLKLAINIRAVRHTAQDATPDQVANIIILRTRLQYGCFQPHLGIVSAELSYYADDILGIMHEA